MPGTPSSSIQAARLRPLDQWEGLSHASPTTRPPELSQAFSPAKIPAHSNYKNFFFYIVITFKKTGEKENWTKRRFNINYQPQKICLFVRIIWCTNDPVLNIKVGKK
jgi:hypothetical protein